MALTSEKIDSDGRRRSLFKLPFRNSSDHQATSSSSSSRLSDNYIHQSRHFRYQGPRPVVERLGQTHHQQPAATIPSMSSVARSLLPTKRRLKLDPSSKLYFPCELLYRNSDHYFLRVTGKLRFFWIIVVIIMTQLRNEKKFSFFFLSFFLGMLILDIGYCRWC